MPASFSDLKPALADLSLSHHLVLVHAAPSLNAEALFKALLETTEGFFTPTFTPKTLLPLAYHPAHPKAEHIAQAVPFTPQTPADEAFGPFAELVRKHPAASRSIHPALSFAGIQAESALHTQTLSEPYGPIAALAEVNGVILLAGLDQRVNFSIHLGEKMAGRMQFIRWARNESGIVECPHFPGDAEGFNALTLTLKPIVRQVTVLGHVFQAIPTADLLRTVVHRIHEDAYSLLCGRPDCERCEAVRWG